MLLNARDIVLRLDEVEEARLRKELSVNLCRGTGHVATVTAVAAQNEDFRALYAQWKPFLDSSDNGVRTGRFTLDAFRYGNAIPSR